MCMYVQFMTDVWQRPVEYFLTGWFMIYFYMKHFQNCFVFLKDYVLKSWIENSFVLSVSTMLFLKLSVTSSGRVCLKTLPFFWMVLYLRVFWIKERLVFHFLSILYIFYMTLFVSLLILHSDICYIHCTFLSVYYDNTEQ